MQCIVCRQTMASMLELQMHCRHHFQTKSTFHTCCIFSKSFESNKNLISKLNSSGRTYYVCKPCYHGESNDYTCNRCGATFESTASLQAHATTHKKQFSSGHEIQLHVATHMMEWSVHECMLCFVILDSPVKLQCHLIEHTYKHSEYWCCVCGHTFENAVEIQSHATEHGISALKYGCNQCNQNSFFSAELENRMNLHKMSVDQPRCTKQFDNQSLVICPLNNHSLNDIVTHKNSVQSEASSCFNVQSQFVQLSSSEDDICRLKCDKTFSTVFELTNHYKKYHSDNKEKTIQCSHCSDVNILQSHFFSFYATNGSEIRKMKPVCMECGRNAPPRVIYRVISTLTGKAVNIPVRHAVSHLHRRPVSLPVPSHVADRNLMNAPCVINASQVRNSIGLDEVQPCGGADSYRQLCWNTKTISDTDLSNSTYTMGT